MKKEMTKIKILDFRLSSQDLLDLVRQKYDVDDSWKDMDINLVSHETRWKGVPFTLMVSFEKQSSKEI